MKARDLEESDESRIKELFDHQKLEISLPHLSMFTATVGIESEGALVMAVVARPTVELFLIADPGWSTPGMREAALKLAHEEMNKRLAEKNYFDAHAWIPPRIARSFGRRLVRKFKEFNWTASTWPCFTVFVKR